MSEIVKAIIYSKFDDKMGPIPFAWIPSDVSKDIRNLVSMRSINLLMGEQGEVPKSLVILPFTTLHVKGMIRLLEVPKEVRGGATDSSITVLYEEESDPIFYKYFQNFEGILDQTAKKILELEGENADKKAILEELENFNSSLNIIINELRDVELSADKEEAFPMGEKEEEVKVYRYKIIVCGDPAVGKTSTVLRFTDKAFKKSYLPTIGTSISEKKIQIKNKNIQFVIWDIAGQSKFQLMRKHFYQGADGQLLIFDLTRPETLQNIGNWHQDIKSYLKEDRRGYILGNKADLVDERKVDKVDISRLTENLKLEYIETSALSGQNIDEAFIRLGELLSTERKVILD